MYIEYKLKDYFPEYKRNATRVFISCNFCHRLKYDHDKDYSQRTFSKIIDEKPFWICSEQCKQEYEELYL